MPIRYSFLKSGYVYFFFCRSGHAGVGSVPSDTAQRGMLQEFEYQFIRYGTYEGRVAGSGASGSAAAIKPADKMLFSRAVYAKGQLQLRWL